MLFFMLLKRVGQDQNSEWIMHFMFARGLTVSRIAFEQYQWAMEDCNTLCPNSTFRHKPLNLSDLGRDVSETNTNRTQHQGDFKPTGR